MGASPIALAKFCIFTGTFLGIKFLTRFDLLP